VSLLGVDASKHSFTDIVIDVGFAFDVSSTTDIAESLELALYDDSISTHSGEVVQTVEAFDCNVTGTNDYVRT
jgi:hypothetical protein